MLLQVKSVAVFNGGEALHLVFVAQRFVLGGTVCLINNVDSVSFPLVREFLSVDGREFSVTTPWSKGLKPREGLGKGPFTSAAKDLVFDAPRSR